MEIDGKKAVIVGGASGMARASAEQLHAKGASIAILDLPTSAGAAVAAGLGGTFHPVDVMDEHNTESAPSLFSTGLTRGIPDQFAEALTKDAAFPRRMGRPEEYGRLAVAIVENPMLNGGCIRLDAGQRFAPK